MKRLVELFFEFFKISLFIIGGGYAILAVADDVFAKKGWTEEGEIVDKLPVFQMVPGLIATHTAVYVGNKLAGGLGALVGVTAVALPAIIIFTCVSMGYDALPVGHPLLSSVFVGLRSALTGIIAAADMMEGDKLADMIKSSAHRLDQLAQDLIYVYWGRGLRGAEIRGAEPANQDRVRGAEPANQDKAWVANQDRAQAAKRGGEAAANQDRVRGAPPRVKEAHDV